MAHQQKIAWKRAITYTLSATVTLKKTFIVAIEAFAFTIAQGKTVSEKSKFKLSCIKFLLLFEFMCV